LRDAAPVLMHVIINLDKPKGITSQQAVTRVKKIWRAKKAGHAGTLDPLATGVLLVCTGEATKTMRFLSDLDKEYVAVMKLGEKTDTLDAEGEVLQAVRDIAVTKKDIEEVLGRFSGAIQQNPPMYSALKTAGTPLYKLARKGIVVERPKREVLIHSIEVTGFDLPLMEIRVSCSKGTYIRTLCADIGDVLGVGAHIVALRRTRIGRFLIGNAVPLDGVEEAMRRYIADGTNPAVSTIDAALVRIAEFTMTEGEFRVARNGVPIRYRGERAFVSESYLRLNDPQGRLFAIGRMSNGMIKVERMLHLAGDN
jgi:tRNA pseudouridine55 synthase